MEINNYSSFENAKLYNEGSCKQVYIIKNNQILKVPKSNDSYNTFLRGTNQILTEIDIWNRSKEFKDILCPIINYGNIENLYFSINKKIIPSNIYLNQKNFNLNYFCNKINYDYYSILPKIEKFAQKFNLDLYDLIENEENFGYDIETNKILLLDFGFKYTINYNNNNSLQNNNNSLINKIFK